MKNTVILNPGVNGSLGGQSISMILRPSVGIQFGGNIMWNVEFI